MIADLCYCAAHLHNRGSRDAPGTSVTDGVAVFNHRPRVVIITFSFRNKPCRCGMDTCKLKEILALNISNIELYDHVYRVPTVVIGQLNSA